MAQQAGDLWSESAGINRHIHKRLDHLLAWLAKAAPDVVSLQELKAEQGAFPEDALRTLGYELIPHQSTRLVRRELLQKLRLRFRLLRHPTVRRSLFRKLFGGMRISREAILQWKRIRGICKKGFLAMKQETLRPAYQGARVYYLHAGSGRPMLLIDGMVGSSATGGITSTPSLTSVYAIDLVNLGKSQRIEGLDAGLRATAIRIVAVMDALNLAERWNCLL